MAELLERTEDRLLGGRVRLAQPASGYRAAIDPVLLAAATVADEGELVLDAGCGAGAATLCLAARRPGCRITGLELQADIADLARDNVRANGFEATVEIVTGDLAMAPPAVRGTTFDAVMTNPPFLAETQGTVPATAGRRAAHVESLPLPAWLAACLRRLRPGGWLSVVHRADRLPTLLAALDGEAGDIAVLPLWARADAGEAKRVIVRARKGAKGPARLLRGLVLHEADGRYTAAAEAVLRLGEPLETG
ncbi:MAG: methyltransferase [Geminicoccaceae bacterium]